MRILAVETSCDETAVALLEFSTTSTGVSYEVIGERLYSQAGIHARYGGVYPTAAKREHQKTLPLLAHDLLSATDSLHDDPTVVITPAIERNSYTKLRNEGANR